MSIPQVCVRSTADGLRMLLVVCSLKKRHREHFQLCVWVHVRMGTIAGYILWSGIAESWSVSILWVDISSYILTSS